MVSDKCRVGEGNRPSPSPLPPTAGAKSAGGEAGPAGEADPPPPLLTAQPPPAREGSRSELNRGGRQALPLAFPASGGAVPAGGEAGPAEEEPVRLSSCVRTTPPPTGGVRLQENTGEGGRPSPLAPPASGGGEIRRRGGRIGRGGRSEPPPPLLRTTLSHRGGFGCTDEPGRAACPPPRPSRLRRDGIRPEGTGSAGDGPILPSLTLTLSLSLPLPLSRYGRRRKGLTSVVAGGGDGDDRRWRGGELVLLPSLLVG